MGKNYIESSLKRFLKRRVKITLGVVVSFLITGAVAFAEPIITGDGVYIPYDSWVAGIGQGNKQLETAEIKGEFTDGKATTISSKDGKIVINFKDNSSTKEITITNTDISNTILKNVNNALILGRNDGKPEELKLDLTNDNGNYGLGFSLKDNAEIKNSAKKSGEITVNEVGIEITDYQSASPSTVMVAGQVAQNGGIIVNKGIINTPAPIPNQKPNHIFGQYAEGKNSAAYNYGIIKNDYLQGQSIRSGAYGYNYGLIINNGTGGQQGFDNEKESLFSYLFNYGVIANNGGGGQGGKFVYNYGLIANTTHTGQSGSKAYNYGIIANNSYFGQYGAGNGAEVYNFGVIANNGEKGQYLAGREIGSKLVNYGLIKNNGNYGQYVESSSSNKDDKVINYGIIANNGKAGQYITQNVTGYNYGIIANTNTDEKNISDNASIYSKGKAYNYGFVYNIKGYGVSGDVKNNGIILSTETGQRGLHTFKENGKDYKPINNGVVIIKNNVDGVNKNECINNGVEIDASTNNIKISIVGDNMLVATNQNDNVVTADKKFDSSKDLENNKNLFVDRYTTSGKLTDTVTLTNTELKGNHITTVLGDTTDKAVISTKDDLTLTDSSIVGYFEKTGTLLTVNGDLTLSGESIINAISGNGVKDVAAVKLTDNGTLTIGENSKVLGAVKGNGTLVYENIDDELYSNTQEVDSTIIRTTKDNTTNIALSNLTLKDSGTGVDNAGKFIIDNQSDKKLEGKEVSITITLANNINIENGIDGRSSANGIELVLGDGQTSSDKTINIDSITLGTGDDILTINNVLGKVGVIDGNGGKDIVNLKNLNGTHDSFDYQLKNIDTLDLNNHTWKIGENANISHDTTAKAGEKTTIQNGTLMGELKGTAETSAEFVNKDNVNNVLGNSTFGENAKFQMNIGKDMKLEAGAEYNLDNTTKNNLASIKDKVTASAIFTTAKDDTSKELRVKSAKEMNIDERYSGIYEEMLKNASSNSEILDTLNSSDVSSIANAINGKGALGDTLATTGYKITRDISNSFMSAVNEWDKKADKGEWLTNAKYISSDVEYDGANNVKGYDSDINSMIGMIEYGVSENTAYGIALGGGDTEIDDRE